MPEIRGIETPEIIRCAYCAEIMKARTEGDWFLCPHCEHVTIPSYPSYLCSCQQCDQLRPKPRFVLWFKVAHCRWLTGRAVS